METGWYFDSDVDVTCGLGEGAILVAWGSFLTEAAWYAVNPLRIPSRPEE